MKRPAANDLSQGIVGRAVWTPCRVNPKTAIIHCDCKDFILRLKADGTTEVLCVRK